ncbi:MAG TPA: glycosyltransferase family 2 protein [Sphingobacteriaceae bacterium]|nr:glycosyltransferase family 2 protein [Sphingobacteriaceae bacterium]
MRYPANHSIYNDFDTSIILPFYKKLDDFKVIIRANAPYFQRNGIEVIIVMDEDSEQQGVLELIKQSPLINWRVIVNSKVHGWRNPCKTINVGIKAAAKSYVMVCSPESEFHTDAIFRLRYMAEHYSPCFTVGKVFFGKHDNRGTFGRALPYGSIMVKKEYLEKIGGYSEFFDRWGGEDNNFRAKLEYAGIKKVYVDDAILIHYEEEQEGHTKRDEKSAELSENIVKRAFYPEKEDFTDENWGKDFEGIVYDYRHNEYAEELCRTYLSVFKKFEICRPDAFTKQFKVIALVQTYNEKAHIPEALIHLDGICDGIILLDDESTDGTYELAKSEKLLLKVQKKRKEFDDLENRNLLLDIASFIKSEWLFFIDADERLMLWDSKLEDLCSVNVNAYCFYLVHLWDSETTYRTDIPEQSPVGIPGVLHRWRMFKHTGRSQIVNNNKLHFEGSPYLPDKKVIIPVLIVHYGMLNQQIRERKYHNYIKEDSAERHKNYRYFLDEDVCLERLEGLPRLTLRQFTQKIL